MSWLQQLKSRWKVNSLFQVLIILLVFACTGTTVLFLKKPLFHYLFSQGSIPSIATVIYYVLILPIYNLFLLFYGLLFGQFKFFWDFEKKFFNRIINIFRKKNNIN